MGKRKTLKSRFIFLFLVLAVSTISLPVLRYGRTIRASNAPINKIQPDEERCQPWQYRDEDGHCKDRPGVHHHHGHYDPQPGETCWIECLCREGQAPSGNSCGSCSFVGMVCKSD